MADITHTHSVLNRRQLPTCLCEMLNGAFVARFSNAHGFALGTGKLDYVTMTDMAKTAVISQPEENETEEA